MQIYYDENDEDVSKLQFETFKGSLITYWHYPLKK